MTILLAPAKLTLSLRITGVRPDGHHLIDAEMVTIDLHDTVEIRPGPSRLRVVGGGDDVPTDDGNLVMQALAAVGRTADVELTKRIPSRAGLGGGSADAAAILRWAGVTDPDVALAVGADVAFCVVGGRARVTGVGESVEPLPHVEQTLTLVTPPVECSTAQVYRAWDDLGGPRNHEGANDLEAAALDVAPELARWRDELEAVAGTRPTLAGSGSTWFVAGAFPGQGRVVATTVPRGWSATD